MTFHVNKQEAAQINMVAGDQHNRGGHHVLHTADRQDPASLLARLEDELTRTPLPSGHAQAIHAVLVSMHEELESPANNRASIAQRLTRITGFLTSAGALTVAGTGLVSALSAFATWLGALGEPVRQALSSAGVISP
ncbi:hypothetical protein ACQ86D_22015 [Streptomyces galilaeus]